MSLETFAGELRRVMSRTDIADLSAAMGVTERAIRSWIRAERVPAPQVVFTLEERLALTPGTLSRHLGYLPVGREEAEALAATRIARRAREDAGRYRAEVSPDVARLVSRVDVDEAARRGLQLELMRVAVEDFEAEHGPLGGEEIDQARHDLVRVIDRSGSA